MDSWLIASRHLSVSATQQKVSSQRLAVYGLMYRISDFSLLFLLQAKAWSTEESYFEDSD